jgi:hypothetical protein
MVSPLTDSVVLLCTSKSLGLSNSGLISEWRYGLAGGDGRDKTVTPIVLL